MFPVQTKRIERGFTSLIMPKGRSFRYNDGHMSLTGKKILAVDDDPFILDYVTRFLTAKGIQVITTTDPEGVLELAEKEKPHLIISDIAMPGMNGLSLLKLLKENAHTQNIPLVLLTSSSRLDDVNEGLSSGAEAYLRKPIDWDRDWPKLQTLLLQ